MKKEELFDLLENVDQKYINEAMFDDLDGDSPAVARPGKARITPMKIIAPVAACLAVFVAAGFLVVNVNRGKLAIGPAASIEESSEVGETSEPAKTKTFVENCKDIVISELTNDLPDDAEWLELYFDIDFDGEDELLLCPHVEYKKLEGVPGYRVFKEIGTDDVQDLGAFNFCNDRVSLFHNGNVLDENGEIFEVFDTNKIDFCYIDESNKKYYYFVYGDHFEAHSDTIYEVFFNEETGIIEENAYLQYVSTFPEDESSSTPFTETAYRYGTEVGMKEFLEEWNTFPNMPNVLPFEGNVGIIQIIDILTEKYGVSEEDYTALIKPYRNPETVYAGDGKARIAYGLIDATNDGKSETYVTFENCEQLRGFYIFERDGAEIRLIGEFDLEGKRLGANPVEMFEEHGKLLNKDNLYEIYDDDNGERFRFFYTYESEQRGDDILAKRSDMHKIVVNEDGTLGDEIIITFDEEYSFSEDKSYYPRVQLYGEDVPIAEAIAEAARIETIANNYRFDSPNRFRT